MAGCGRRLAVRAGAACFAAVLGAGSTALVSEAAATPLQITVQVGYHNTVKLGQWVPVTVDLTNSGPAVDGTLEVQANNSTGNGGPPLGAATYQTPISLASGATKHVRTYVTQDVPGTVAVRVVQDGHVVASDAPGREQLLKLLCDPDFLRVEESIELARRIARADPRLETTLVRMMPRPDSALGTSVCVNVITPGVSR